MFEIITDVTCDLQRDILIGEKVKVVPLYIIKPNEERIKITIDYDFEKFYSEYKDLILKGALKTSQPSINDFLDAYKSSDYEEIVVITLSSKLSGTYNVALSSSKLIKNKKIYVIDSKQASIGLGLLVRELLKLRKKGLSAMEAIEEIKKVNVQTYAAIVDINFLLNSGRINIIKYAFLRLVNKKPIVKVTNGELQLYKLSDDPFRDIIDISRGKKEVIFGGSIDFFYTLPEPKVLVNPIVATVLGPAFGVAFIE